ncbi:50S ribosomal protein L27 [Candidatus Falkowbacteria bacterium CG10_big_fil_rev_8_21_14_0_10_43_11]|uniref:Large ribosomal subunit protein bL27 n=1 Tax=Candidatus Falkowbacteria bacterium CG10_big_fil_rev_8_21_14_0_10_43_11 TaxID=1974568 RepID=A0A2M6WMA7_9BACT|nr:MAG: 50S ribosomal protein L27 [Candidatus Falkowbacteria bacterium CG10_big_fil_rev_8_21_14_0_10_43_11]
MAHKKAGGSTTLGRDSRPKYLGVKLHEGENAKVGSIIIRQRGTKWHPGKNVKKGGDDTIFSLINGAVKFTKKTLKKYDGSLKQATVVNVLPAQK